MGEKIHGMKSARQTRTRFGTFSGVFTPCVLMLLGVILFLRLGQITGQAGLWQCLLIISFATLITTLTGLSLSSLATNTRVRGGGAYFLISRSLGVEYGAAIGPVLFLALATSVALYVIGFTEALMWLFPKAPLSAQLCATVVNLLIFACVYTGAGWAIKVQFFILSIIVLSLASFFCGALAEFSVTTLQQNLEPAYPPGESLYTTFALFFPAVTGIMAGTNMSGDLKEPGRAIPRGTLQAIGVSTLIYVLVAVVMASTQSREDLLQDSNIIGNIALSPALVAAGIFAATLSSAISAMMGAPRILQALARDKIFRPLAYFESGSGRNREPRRAIVLTFLLAQCGILLGDLNTIAPLITLFFLIAYGAINLACFYEAISGNPSFRPLFPLNHWSIGLGGALSCLMAMLLIEPWWSAVAIVGFGLLVRQVKRSEVHAYWGDVQWGNSYELARRALLRLNSETYHPKSWRPSILAISEGRWSSQYRVAEYATWLQGGRGIVTLAQVEHGEVEYRMRHLLEEQEYGQQFIRDEHLDSFYTVVIEDSLLDGLRALLQTYGIGNLRPNTVLFAWQADPIRAGLLADMVATTRDFECSAIAVSVNQTLERWETRSGPIDVWWHSRKNAALMLILAYLMTHSRAWRKRPIRLFHAVSSEDERDSMLPAMVELLASARVEAESQVVIGNDIASTIVTHSSNAGVVILGIDPPGVETPEQWHQNIQQLITGLYEVVLVSSEGDVRLGN